MKLPQAFVASAALLVAVGLSAQTTTTTTSNSTDASQSAMTPPANMPATTMPADGTQSTMTQNSTIPATSQAPMSYPNRTGQTMSGMQWEADVTAPYAFRFRTTGVSADIGADAFPGNFLGFEYTYFHVRGSTNDPVAGTVNSKEDISTYQFAYRYRRPLAQFAMNGQPSPVDFYAGVSAGVGTVRLKTSDPAFGFQSQSSDSGVFSAEGSAGLQWNFCPHLGIKAGYRYIYLNHVELYGQRGNIDSGIAEVGLNFHW